MNLAKRTAWLLPLLLLATDVWAGERGAGKYSGMVVFDRWDGCTLYSGVYVMYISEHVKEKLRKHTGKSVQIDATKVHQPINPGDGLITEFTYLGPAPPTMNWVSLSDVEVRATPSFTSGERPTVIISVLNHGKSDVRVHSSELAPTLLTKTSGGRTPADGPSYALITRQAFIVGGTDPRTEGRGVRGGGPFSWSIDQGLPRTFALSPGAERRIRITFDLPEGEYEFLAGYGGGVHEGKGIASNLVAFDVTKDGKARLAKIDELVESLSSKNPFEAAQAASGLGERQPTASAALDALVSALSDTRIADDIPFGVPAQRRTVATSAADALVTIGEPAVDRLARYASNHHPQHARILALMTLGRMGHVAHASTPVLEVLLKDDAYTVRFHAVETFALVQQDARKKVAALRTVLSDPSPHVRSFAVRKLTELEARASACIPQISKLLDDQEDRAYAYAPDMIGTRPVRYDAAMALANMGDASRPALPKLREMMEGDKDPVVRIAASLGVARLDKNASAALTVLIRELSDQEGGQDAPYEAARALGSLSQLAKPAVPALIRALEHAQPLIRITAAESLAAIDPANAKTALLPLLQDDDGFVRSEVIETLGNLRRSEDDVIAALILALDDEELVHGEHVRHAAAIALGKLGPDTSAALPKLRQIAKDDSSQWVREAAATAISQIMNGSRK